LNTAAFWAAVTAGQPDRVRDLLASDPALATVRDDDGATPLHLATERGHREIVSLLLASGADVNARDDRFGATPTGWAIEYLREQGGLLGIEIEDVVIAIRAGEISWVRRWLVRLPALAKACDFQGKPLSQHARESGHAEIARLFEEGSAG
jgi:Ankyrin repeats (3 copies)